MAAAAISHPRHLPAASASTPYLSRRGLLRSSLTPTVPVTTLLPSKLSSSLPFHRPNSVAPRDPPARNGGGGARQQRSHADEVAPERPVHCEVEVVSWRERRIRAEVTVAADVDSVWGALTDYDRLADFIPNLVHSGTVPCPRPGRIWLEQIGLQQALYWHIEARVVLDLQEIAHSVKERDLCFSMVDGDFKKFEGKWSVKAVPRYTNTTLSYEVNVIPKFNFPVMFIERIIKSDLPVNLRALANRAESTADSLLKTPGHGTAPKPSSSPQTGLSSTVTETIEPSVEELKEKYTGSDLDALRSSPSAEPNSNWGVFGKFCSLDRPCMVDEVHLRRFDDLLEDGGAHRCVVASITVKSPVRDVWNVLTAYEKLPEIVPNLAISKILLRENTRVRVLQEGCKGLLYMVLHARVILDLDEKFEEEISFEQVEGDFDSFRGKWLFEQLGNQHTLLKYTIESKMHKETFLSEGILEEVIYEDLPSNLCAIRDYVEKRHASELYAATTNKKPSISTVQTESAVKLEKAWSTDVYSRSSKLSTQANLSKQRPKVPGLQRDLDVLKSELIAFITRHGQEGFMPMRKQLRLHGRVDIEKAITRMGGFRRIASLLNLSLAYKERKPKGYWDNLENLQEEIIRFQRSWGMDLTYMPSRKTFERAGRYDIARALEKWGGLQEVSRLLSLELRHPRRHLPSAEKIGDSRQSNGLGDNEKVTSKPYVSQDTEKWLLKLKDLEINWLE